MESSDGVEPEIAFYPVKTRRYGQYSSELCVFSHRMKGRGSVQGLCRVE